MRLSQPLLIFPADFVHLKDLSWDPNLHPLSSDFLLSQKPNAHLVVTIQNRSHARCSLWWSQTPPLKNKRIGVIGHYAAIHLDSGRSLLRQACQILKDKGCSLAIGPMDGHTWRDYRFITERGTEPPFFLEPDHPDDWVQHFITCGFSPIARYSSTLNENLSASDPRLSRVRDRLQSQSIRIRSFQFHHLDEELVRLHGLSMEAFGNAHLFTPLDRESFIQQYRPLQTLIDPRLILLAETDDRTVGYLFAIPDHAQKFRGTSIDTVILKTLAIQPHRLYAGLGALLVELVQHQAQQLGYRKAIHALMHEQNRSQNIGRSSTKVFRRYALFGKQL